MRRPQPRGAHNPSFYVRSSRQILYRQYFAEVQLRYRCLRCLALVNSFQKSRLTPNKDAFTTPVLVTIAGNAAKGAIGFNSTTSASPVAKAV